MESCSLAGVMGAESQRRWEICGNPTFSLWLVVDNADDNAGTNVLSLLFSIVVVFSISVLSLEVEAAEDPGDRIVELVSGKPIS